MAYPSTIDNFTNPLATDRQDLVSHADQHSNANNAIEAIEAVMGTTAGTSVLKDVLQGQFVATKSGTETLTNKTLTSPVINTGVSGNSLASSSEVTTGTIDTKLVTPKALKDAGIVAFTPDLTMYSNLNAPEGFLINGKIIPSVASNNLTVAIKGMDGNDPSASNPVYCRIDNTVRTITSALSVTKNAGTNWCNAGGTELATKEADYFVYLGYNATDGVVVGFSRIPFANQYDEFSTTSTNEKYCAISTITNAAAGDKYSNIGRFAATLSGGAGYTWSVPTFTATNLIQRPIYETRILEYTTAYTGFSSNPNGTYTYQLIGNTCYINHFDNNSGTSNATTFTLSMPFSSLYNSITIGLIYAQDNTSNQTAPGNGVITAGSNTLTLYKTFYNVAWTSSGSKNVFFKNLSYKI